MVDVYMSKYTWPFYRFRSTNLFKVKNDFELLGSPIMRVKLSPSGQRFDIIK